MRETGRVCPGYIPLPPGDFDVNIFDVTLNRKTIRGSIVGTRQDLSESLVFAAEGKVKVHYPTERSGSRTSIRFSRIL